MIRSQADDPKPRAPSLTRAEIIRIAGDIGDAKVVAIEAMGATTEELEAAAAWAVGESDVMGKLRLPLTGRTAALYDILTADEDYGDERD